MRSKLEELKDAYAAACKRQNELAVKLEEARNHHNELLAASSQAIQEIGKARHELLVFAADGMKEHHSFFGDPL